MAKEQYQLNWTRDYDQFDVFSFNREVDFSRVEKIKKAIEENGFLVPILVNQDNLVVDGQHRLEAAKILGCEIAYVKYPIDEEKVALVIADLNTTSRTWRTVDYLYMWNDKRKDAYVWLQSKMDEHTILFSDIYKMFAGAVGDLVAVGKAFRRGTLTFTDTQKKRLSERMSNLTEIRNLEKRFSDFGPGFSSALAKAVSSKNYEHQRMVSVIKEYPGTLLRARTTGEYCEQIEQMYNKSLPPKKRIRLVTNL